MNDSIKKYSFKNGLPLEFEILDLAEIFDSKKKLMTVPHRAQFYHIIWIEKGKGNHIVDFNPIELEDNIFLFVPSNSVNLFDRDGIYTGKTLIFTDSFFCKNKQDLQFLRTSILYSNLYQVAKIKVNSQSSELIKFLDLMEVEFQKEADYAHYHILHNLLHVFLLEAEREMRKQGFIELKPSANLDYLILFKDLLERNFRNSKSVNKYASQLSITEKQLNKATTTLLEKTPKQIIDERIILEAKRLLVHSTQSIKEIAYDLGYDEPTNFIKYFRKHTNSTPSEFREKF